MKALTRPVRSSRVRQKIFSIAALLVILLTQPLAAIAQDLPASPASPNDIDDGFLEVGVWYVNDYQNCGGWGLGDLPNTDDDALGLRSRLTAPFFFFFFPYPTPQWGAPIVWGNGNAWEEDWKRTAGAGGGGEEWQIDQVDLAYFSGHGAASGVFFGVGGNSRDDCQNTKADAEGAWGTRDNDWIGLAACNVLDNPFDNFVGWARAMNGTRLLMGMQTVMSDVDYGSTLGWHLRWGRNFTQAWFWTADATLPGWQVARILAEHPAYFSDTWANHNSFTSVDNTFHWWTHQAGTPLVGAASVKGVDLALLDGEMPVLQTAVIPLDQAEGNFAQVANAFSLTSTKPISGVVASDFLGPLASDDPLFVSEDGTLLMDPAAGNFLYTNPDKLYSEQAVAAAQLQAAGVSAVREVTPIEAVDVAQNFLGQTGLNPEGAAASTVGSDVLESGETPTRFVEGVEAAANFQVLDSTTTSYKVNFDRVIQIPSGASLDSPLVDFPVVGPGPKLSVYVDATAPATLTAAALAEDPFPLVQGGQGGWRQLLTNAADGVQLMTTVMPTTTMETLFTLIEEKVALDYVPLPADSRQILNIAAGYYEGPIGMNMSELIPVFVVTVKATMEDGSEQVYDTYIPVNALYMAPYAEILTPQTGFAVPGSTVQLKAADASKTLADLGVDPSLTFALGTGDSDSYTYSWYLNEVGETPIATGMEASYTVPAGAGQAGKPFEAKFILVVEDTLKDGEPKVATDDVILSANSVYLPSVDNN